MSALNNSLLLGQEGGGGYAISRSLRFNSSDSAYLGPKTLSSPTSSTTWTWACWIKKTLITTSTDYRGIFTARDATGDNYAYIDFSDNGIRFANRPVSGTIAVLQTTPVFRDPSAWFHLAFVYDSSNGTSTDTLRLYINGSRVTAFSSATYPSASQASIINSTIPHYIGYDAQNTAYVSAYLADIHFCDGTAYDASAFGEFDANGIWQPKKFAGVYGTNGFKLNFSDNSTAAALGTDSSGNGNTWTVNNLSVTAGAGNDSLVDVPVNGSEVDTGSGGQVRGNYCTLNPLSNEAGALSNGNLQQAGTSTANVRCNSTIAVSSGKWYFESTLQTAESFTNIGIGTPGITTQYPGQDSVSYAYVCEQGLRVNAASTGSYGNALTSGDILMVAFDLDNNKIFFGKNGSWFGSSDPAAGTNPAYTITAGTYCPITRAYSTSAIAVLNFGQRPFAYTAPSGFKALCTANLPAPTITQSSTVMDVLTWSGNNAATRAISGLNYSPDLVWIKCRSDAAGHNLYDTVRTAGKLLSSDTTAAETTNSAFGYLSQFDSAGFTLTAGTYPGYESGNVNMTGRTYVGWTWDAGSSTVTNTAGSISSQVRANASAGFSIVTYTGNGSSAQTVGHGLGVAPSLVIVKKRSATDGWLTYFTGFSSNEYLYLDSTVAKASYSGTWGSTPTSTVFGVGDAVVNANGATFVAYCWSPVAGYSSFGSYTGNGSADGPFVYTGFRPRFILVKRTDGVIQWTILDTARSPSNVADQRLFPNLSQAETVNGDGNTDLLSNGFKPRNVDSAFNANGGTYIYMALAESPFQYARAR